MQVTVSTIFGAGCSTVSVADMNCRSMILRPLAVRTIRRARDGIIGRRFGGQAERDVAVLDLGCGDRQRVRHQRDRRRILARRLGLSGRIGASRDRVGRCRHVDDDVLKAEPGERSGLCQREAVVDEKRPRFDVHVGSVSQPPISATLAESAKTIFLMCVSSCLFYALLPGKAAVIHFM